MNSGRLCPECDATIEVEAFNEATIYKCPNCGYSEAWHRYGAESDPQIKHGKYFKR